MAVDVIGLAWYYQINNECMHIYIFRHVMHNIWLKLYNSYKTFYIQLPQKAPHFKRINGFALDNKDQMASATNDFRAFLCTILTFLTK